MHLRRVQDVLQGTVIERQVGVVQILHQRADHRDDQDHRAVHAEHHQRQVGEGFVHHHFAPMKTEVADPVQFLDAVVQFVKLPQPRHDVQQPVDIPFEEIFQQEEGNELQPQRRTGHQRKLFRNGQARGMQIVIQPQNQLAGHQCQQQAEIVAVEGQPEQILPELLTENLLFSPPRRETLQQKHKQGNGDQPEVILQINRHAQSPTVRVSTG